MRALVWATAGTDLDLRLSFRADGERAWFRGPDLERGTGMELVAETWGVRWRELVDDRLVELSDRGGTLAAVAGSVLSERLAEASRGALAIVVVGLVPVVLLSRLIDRARPGADDDSDPVALT